MVRIETATPVIVLGAGRVWSIGLVRSLGRLGIPVYVISSDPHAVAFSSKYCRGRVVSDIPQVTKEALPNLLRIGSKIGRRSVLIPTTDRTAMFVVDNARELSEQFIFPAQNAELVHALCSKKETYNLVRGLKIPTPKAAFPQDKEELSTFLETASFPIILKAIQGWKPPTTVHVIVYSRRELDQNYDLLQNVDDPNLMVQEYIPGDEDATWVFEGYCNENSASVFYGTGRKLRQWRRRAGLISLAVCAANDRLVAMTRDFMKTMHYRGMVDIDYRYDARDRQYKLLDFNPRIGSTFRFLVGDHGMDVARALYLDLTGQPIKPDRAANGRKFLIEDLDAASSLQSILEGELSIKEWFNSYRGVREGMYFARDDMLPFIRMVAWNASEFATGVKTLVGLTEESKAKSKCGYGTF